ncbi:MAG: prephenate dehydratase [Burkholderiales bacterium]|nr:prephenate dehydratase [Burkholderiales bacterium]
MNEKEIPSESIEALRARIDGMDDRILALVNARAGLAARIGELKGGAPVYRPEREAQVLRRLREANAGPLPAEAVDRLFTEVISACRAVEDALSVAYLGPRGTFSEEAAGKRFGSSVRGVPSATIDEVFRLVEARQVGHGVVPVENSTEGAVGRTLDLLLGTAARICGEVALPVHQCLMSKDADMDGIVRVYAHGQSLAQCQGWLDLHLPRAERVAVVSNAEAARVASAEAHGASLGSRAAAPLYGLNVLARNIEDNPSNTTRFVVLGHQSVPRSGRDKTSLVMAAANRPGAMHALLGPFAEHGVSMTRLESRPSKTGIWEYVFFVDIEGHESDARVAAALERLREMAAFLKVLGSYPAAE